MDNEKLSFLQRVKFLFRPKAFGHLFGEQENKGGNEAYYLQSEESPQSFDDSARIVNFYAPCSKMESGYGHNKALLKKVDNLVIGKKLFLDPQLSLTKLGMLIGVNRTYMSNILRERNGFKNYIGGLRIECFCNLMNIYMQKNGNIIPKKEITNLVLQSGFSDLRTFKRTVMERDDEYSRQIRQRIYSPLRELEAEQTQPHDRMAG